MIGLKWKQLNITQLDRLSRDLRTVASIPRARCATSEMFAQVELQDRYRILTEEWRAVAELGAKTTKTFEVARASIEEANVLMRNMSLSQQLGTVTDVLGRTSAEQRRLQSLIGTRLQIAPMPISDLLTPGNGM